MWVWTGGGRVRRGRVGAGNAGGLHLVLEEWVQRLRGECEHALSKGALGRWGSYYLKGSALCHQPSALAPYPQPFAFQLALGFCVEGLLWSFAWRVALMRSYLSAWDVHVDVVEGGRWTSIQDQSGISQPSLAHQPGIIQA